MIIGLLWHSTTSDNLGVIALTQSNLDLVQKVAEELGHEAEFRIYGWRDIGSPKLRQSNVHMVPLDARSLISPSGLYQNVRECDVILDISAGDSFADIYGARRFLFNAISKAVVIVARRPLILSPQTIGPFDRWWTRLAARMLMKRASLIFARDKLSQEYARSIGIKSVRLASDVALKLPFIPKRIAKSRMTRVGLNVSGLLYNDASQRNPILPHRADYKSLVTKLLDELTLNPTIEIHLISHVISDRFRYEDDYRISVSLADQYPNARVAPKFQTPGDAKSYIATMDVFVGSRMHACIAALSSGVAVIPIAYSHKFEGLFHTLDYRHVIDCRNLDQDESVAKIMMLINDRGSLQQDAVRASNSGLELLGGYRDGLTHIMRSMDKR